MNKSLHLTVGAAVVAPVLATLFAVPDVVGSPIPLANDSTIKTGTSWQVGNGGVNAGFYFTVGSNELQVSALGMWDGPNTGSGTAGGSVGDGFQNATNEVGLYSVSGLGSGTLITSVTMDQGTTDTLVSDYRYVSLGSPIDLLPNTTYMLVANAPTVSSVYDRVAVGYTATNITTDAAYGINGSDTTGYYSYGALGFPTTAAGTPAYIAGNLEYTVVPEPASLASLSLGALVLLQRRRRCEH